MQNHLHPDSKKLTLEKNRLTWESKTSLFSGVFEHVKKATHPQVLVPMQPRKGKQFSRFHVPLLLW